MMQWYADSRDNNQRRDFKSQSRDEERGGASALLAHRQIQQQGEAHRLTNRRVFKKDGGPSEQITVYTYK